MESKSITKERSFSVLEIAEMLGVTYSAAQNRLARVNAQPIKTKRVLDKYSDRDLDKIKIPQNKRFHTETFIIYESKMNQEP